METSKAHEFHPNRKFFSQLEERWTALVRRNLPEFAACLAAPVVREFREQGRVILLDGKPEIAWTSIPDGARKFSQLLEQKAYPKGFEYGKDFEDHAEVQGLIWAQLREAARMRIETAIESAFLEVTEGNEFFALREWARSRTSEICTDTFDCAEAPEGWEQVECDLYEEIRAAIRNVDITQWTI